MKNCIECYLKSGFYPNFTCGECGRYAAGEQMSDKEIREVINDLKTYEAEIGLFDETKTLTMSNMNLKNLIEEVDAYIDGAVDALQAAGKIGEIKRYYRTVGGIYTTTEIHDIDKKEVVVHASYKQVLVLGF